jgi:hypothetical protein
MAFLILPALWVVPALAFLLGLIPLPALVVVEIGALLGSAWWLDRGRAIGARAPFLDENRPEFPVPFGAAVRPQPTEAIEQPKDRPGAL